MSLRPQIDRQLLAWLGVGLAYWFGLTTDVLQIDAAQYAAISRNVSETGRWLEFFDRGAPYLDKPPLLFWLSGLSFKLFGVSNFAYKLPSVVAFFLGVYSTYALGKRYAGGRSGMLSALVLGTCQGAFLMTSDVRTDTLLTGFVAFSLWQLARFLDRPRVTEAALLGLGLGGAMLAKGMIGLMIPVLGGAAQIAARRQWRRAVDPRWLAVTLVVAVLLTPMSIGLYRQHGGAGLEFYYWTQGFGRVFGENIWGDEHGLFFFIPQMLWTFLPWTVFLPLALIARLGDLKRSGWRIGKDSEVLTLGAFVLGFVGLSLSQSKLPHYIYVTLPAAAVLTGTWLDSWLAREPSGRRLLARVQRGILAALGLLVLVLISWLFPLEGAARWAAVAAWTVAAGWTLRSWDRGRRSRLILASTILIGAVNVSLNGHVFPRLLEFQATGRAGRRVQVEARDGSAMIAYRTGAHALDFYSRRVATPVDALPALRVALVAALREDAEVWIFTHEQGLAELGATSFEIEIIERYDTFHVSKLTGLFLDPRTRSDATSARFLLRVR